MAVGGSPFVGVGGTDPRCHTPCEEEGFSAACRESPAVPAHLPSTNTGCSRASLPPMPARDAG